MEPAVVIGSRTQGLAVIRAFGAVGVPVIVLRYHDQDMGHRSRWVREVIDCAHPEHDPDRFLAQLAEVAGQFPGALLVPPSDVTVVAVSEHLEELTRLGFVVAAPDAKVVRTCVDKAATYSFAEANGVPAPKTIPVHGRSDLARFAAEVGFPGVLKPIVGHRYRIVFKQKWTRVDTLDDAVRHHERARAAGFDMVLQELIGGDELCGANYNAYLDEDGVRVEMTAAKIRNSPADTGSPSVVVSRWIPEVAEAGRRMLTALGYRGFANVEFKRDPRDGVYKIIEINARHNLSGMLAIRCGINFPWLEYRHRILGEVPAAREYEQGVYWIDITRDLKASASYLRRDDYSLRRFLLPYLSRPVFAVAARDDPRPALIRGAHDLAAVRRLLSAKAAAVRSAMRGGIRERP